MRNLSPNMLHAVMVEETGEVFLPFVTLKHETFDAPVRLVANGETMVRGGFSYAPSAFEVTMPDDAESGGIPVVKLTLDNVEGTLVKMIRGITGYVEVDVAYALASDPDTAELEYPAMRLRGVEYDVLKVEGTLSIASNRERPVSKLRMTPQVTPGIF